MATLEGPAKGFTAALSGEGTGRLLVGLSWTPKDAGARPPSKIPPLRDAQGRYDTFYFFKLPFYILRAVFSRAFRLAKAGAARDPHDLDLFCYVFDKSMALSHVIGPKNAELIDPSQKVYHTGENQTGREGGDAEQIFVDTRDVPENYQNFIFVVKSANSHSLGDISQAKVRLVESATNEVRLQNAVAAAAAAPGNAYGYVFCSVYRDVSGWAFRNIDSFAGRAVDWNLLLPALEIV